MATMEVLIEEGSGHAEVLLWGQENRCAWQSALRKARSQCQVVAARSAEQSAPCHAACMTHRAGGTTGHERDIVIECLFLNCLAGKQEAPPVTFQP